MDDLKRGLKLARDIRIPVKETMPSTDSGLLNQYAELKILNQFLNGFDVGVFEKLR